ncbi:hypothetical protein KY366_08335 [Candidatus Woesearchaeota archaeon]|nr:hypothetical protein [Candidatus Woesearchaeota archaeon]
MRLKKIKVLIETKENFLRELDKELNEIEKGRKRTFERDTISFQSIDQFRKFMTPKRLQLLRAIRHLKPKSIYGLAHYLNRTPENVNTDIRFLEKLGFIETHKIKDVRDKIIPKVKFDKINIEITV